MTEYWGLQVLDIPAVAAAVSCVSHRLVKLGESVELVQPPSVCHVLQRFQIAALVSGFARSCQTIVHEPAAEAMTAGLYQ